MPSTKPGPAPVLTRSFSARSESIVSLKASSSRMGCLGCFRLVQSGTSHRYVLISAQKEHAVELELWQDRITMNFPIAEARPESFTRDLLMFLSILAYLDGIYTIKLGELYGPIIQALRPGGQSTVARPDLDQSAMQRLEVLNESNIALSQMIIALRAEKLALKRELATLKNSA